MKFLVKTYGCQMNVRDSEAVVALMKAAGHELVTAEKDAELVLVNSCTVRDMAERKAIGKSGNLSSEGKIVGLMGCAVKRLGDDVFKKVKGLSFAVSPRRIGLVPKIVADGVYPRLELDDGNEIPTGLDAHDVADFKAFVTILVGCDNRCSYCIVPDVRGHEYSRPAGEVLAEARALVAHGVKEICFLGQSVLRYGRRTPAWLDDWPRRRSGAAPVGEDDWAEPFPRLLAALSEIEGLKRIRFTSAHPKGCTDELVRAYRQFPQVCRHLHLPVQSGSDRVLSEMGRHYTRAEYLAAIRKLRAFDPEFAITTDVIVGYPGETEADFEETRSLMEEAQFDNAFVFKYSPRPGTRSAALPDDVSTAEKERRDQVLLADQQSRGRKRNQMLVGTVREVLAEGPSLRNAERWSGRDSGNRIVVFPPPAGLKPGAFVSVRITEAHPQILVGEAI